MESIQHFSHDYDPLFLKKFGENEEEKEFVCYGCQEQITEKDNYYACQYCSVYLHKKCADLPEEINLPCHQHPLTLLSHFPYYDRGIGECSICQRSDWNWFTYHCFLCKFDIDVICSFFQQEGKNNNFLQEGKKMDHRERERMESIQHFCHRHPLFLKKFGENEEEKEFGCEGCGEQITEKDNYYACQECSWFYLHKKCADLPEEINLRCHQHPLTLFASSPYKSGRIGCDMCQRSDWKGFTYHCSVCQFDIDAICSFFLQEELTIGESEIQDEEGDTESSQLMQLPFSNRESVPDPTSLFVANKIASVAYDDGPTEISHRLHHHPISIITTKNVAYNDMICDGCVLPISAPFYSCSSKYCNFFLHKFCAELPEELQCPLDSGHSIKVKKSKSCYDLFQCSFCLRRCNGFLCECVSCHLKLDIGCASNLIPIPSRIKHDSHGQHPLVRRYLSWVHCNACNGSTFGRCVYSCEACSFNLGIDCVNYPGSVRHEYDRHSIPLTYPPIKDHPSDFICEICEEDINPRDWMYHCKDCNQSFHTDCLSPFDWFSNVKFGGKVSIDKIHTHPLTFVRNNKSENASLCGQCGRDRNGRPIMECAPCGFKLCHYCAENI